MNDKPFAEPERLRLRSHSVHLENRELMSITGVKDAASFNEEEVILMTDAGSLAVEGEGLHITKLDLDEGHIVIEGLISAVEYDDMPEQKSGIFSRFFH